MDFIYCCDTFHEFADRENFIFGQANNTWFMAYINENKQQEYIEIQNCPFCGARTELPYELIGIDDPEFENIF